MITTQPLSTKPLILACFEIRLALTWSGMLPGGLYIDPVFSANQRFNGIWTCDMESGGTAGWVGTASATASLCGLCVLHKNDLMIWSFELYGYFNNISWLFSLSNQFVSIIIDTRGETS